MVSLKHQLLPSQGGSFSIQLKLALSCVKLVLSLFSQMYNTYNLTLKKLFLIVSGMLT
jgi:hypothetical protein